MAKLVVTDREGRQRAVEAPAGQRLMDVLRDEDFGVLATCGGACACGTCHVYVDAAWSAKLPARSDDEQMMLEAIGELVEVKPESRLSCQIELSEDLTGLAVTIGPVA
jgi:2Fe-2S ferredoxin